MKAELTRLQEGMIPSMSESTGQGARKVRDADRADAEEARRVQIAELHKQIAEKAAQEDYAGAATMKAELTRLQEGMIPSMSESTGQGARKVQDADRADAAKAQRVKIAELQSQIDAKAAQGDYAGAATIQAEMKSVQKAMMSSPSAPKGKGAGKVRDADHADAVAQTISIAGLYEADVPIPSRVNFKSVHILSVGKVASVPSKGGGKSKKKVKGKDKGRGKEGGKGKGQDREDAQVVYLGQDGFVICTAAFGACVQKVPHVLPVGLVDVQNLRPRPGQTGLLHWEETTAVVKRLVETDGVAPQAFSYDTSVVSHDLATCGYIQDLQPGQFIALVFLAISVEDRWTESSGDPYVLVYGRDMDGATTTLRFWRFEEGDVQQGSIYIARGMKVVADSYWNAEQWKYVPREDGSKTVECGWRTALEDVTQVSSIAQYFP